MSLDIVGKENLPNIYIKEASIEELDDYSIIVNTRVYLKDIKANTRLQWYDNENLRKSMKIFVVVSSSKTFNEAVESGGYTGGFTPKHLNKIPGYSPGFVDYKIISIQNTDRRKLVESGEPVTGGTLYTLGYQCRFTPKKTSNIAVFATCMLDTEQFAKEEDLDLSHPLINTFYGAIVGEHIIKNNQVQYSTYLFFKGDTMNLAIRSLAFPSKFGYILWIISLRLFLYLSSLLINISANASSISCQLSTFIPGKSLS